MSIRLYHYAQTFQLFYVVLTSVSETDKGINYMGLSRPLLGFIFPFSWYIVSIKLINLTVGSDYRKQEIGRNSRLHSMTHYLRKSLTPSDNRLTAILNQKSLCPSGDLNPACPDRISSLYHLCHTTTALV